MREQVRYDYSQNNRMDWYKVLMFAMKKITYGEYLELVSNNQEFSDFIEKVEKDSILIGVVGILDEP